MLGYFSTHVPVLLNEVLEGFQLRANLHVIDATLGGGGHAQAVLEATAPDGKLLGLDQDAEAIAESKRRLQPFGKRVTIVHSSFDELSSVIHEYQFEYPIHAVLLDLGVSTHHLENASRGFAFLKPGPLDMRMDQRAQTSAADLVNHASAKELTAIFRNFGEEPDAYRIAIAIEKRRRFQPFETTQDLVSCIEEAKSRSSGKHSHHPATRVFQALRIHVNDELGRLEAVLPQALNALSIGGRLAVISFHSLEDRRVKTFFRTESKDCLCPPSFPVCRCDHRAQLKIITKKPIQPSVEELNKNPRSRSAKLRIAEKISYAKPRL